MNRWCRVTSGTSITGLRSIGRRESSMRWDLSCEARSLREAKSWSRNVARASRVCPGDDGQSHNRNRRAPPTSLLSLDDAEARAIAAVGRQFGRADFFSLAALLQRLLKIGDQVVGRLRCRRKAAPGRRRCRRPRASPGGIEAWVISAGYSIRLSTPPRLSASMKRLARVREIGGMRSTPPASTAETMPPKPFICRRARPCCGWLCRPG